MSKRLVGRMWKIKPHLFYLRCRFCDSSWAAADVIDPKPLPKDKKVKHDRVAWECPACSTYNESYIFPNDE